MKKRLALVFVLVFVMAICLFGCDGEISFLPSDTTESHIHEFGEWRVSLAATCTDDGEEVRSCACGESEKKSISATGHTEVIDAPVAPTCTEKGRGEGKHCSLCGEVLAEGAVISELGHTEVVDKAVLPTCTEDGKSEGRHCSVCGEILQKSETIKALGHTEVVENALAPTCTKWGASGDKSCAVCKEVLSVQAYIEPLGHRFENGKCSHCNKEDIDYTDVSLYKSSEGYDFFDIAYNGENMRKLYDEMEQRLTVFHNGNTNAYFFQSNDEIGDLYTVARFNYNRHNLTLEEAQTVYTVFRKDHPAFYWMSYWLYWSFGEIIITTVEEYASAEDRCEYNKILYEGIEKYATLADGESSAYNIALIFYDAITKNNDYAFTPDNREEPAQWAHSVMGDFLYDKFVCEGYAKLFQLLLNLYEVENIYIVGDASGSHCWNLVRMDDGGWYWFDLTWGDGRTNVYDYFCRMDAAMTTHKPTPAYQYGLYFNKPLPTRATTAYSNEDALEIFETFTVGESTYKLSSAGVVTLVSGEGDGGNKLYYKGVVYSISD